MEPGWKPVQPHELPLVLQRPKTGGDPCLVIDTREPAAYFEAHIDGCINVPVPTFTPRSGAEFGHMYSLTQLESDLDPKAARRFQGRKGRRVLIYDDGQGTEPGAGSPMQHLQGGGFRIYPCLFLASLLEEERRASDPNSQACAELFILVGGLPALHHHISSISPSAAGNWQRLIKQGANQRPLQDIRIRRESYIPPSEIMPFLFLGGIENAGRHDKLAELGITHVLNCSSEAQEPYGITLHLPMRDAADESIMGHFQTAFQFIEDCRTKGGRCLLHCQRGISRSPSIAAAYLLWSGRASGATLGQALAHVCDRRAFVQPNLGFLVQLQQYEMQLLGSCSIRIDELGKWHSV